MERKNVVTFCTLSSFLSDHKKFIDLAKDLYFFTDFISNDYSNYFQWYWSKEIPRVINGSGEIIISLVDQEIVGIIFLKNDNERKVCTFYVSEKYRMQHIGTKLLQMAFKYLGTTKPLITFPDYKAIMFEGFIKKYNWKLTQIITKGHYNIFSCEYVYNGSSIQQK